MIDDDNDGSSVVYDATLTGVDERAGILSFESGEGKHAVRANNLGWWHIGTIGRLQLGSDGEEFGFHAYAEQRLRRAPEKDDIQHQKWGWRIGERLFVVKVGIIPGRYGAFVAEDTDSLTLELPRELLDFCAVRGLSPELVLRAFIADLCELMNCNSRPREDGYCSNGADERWLAREYFHRTFGWLDEQYHVMARK